MERQVKLRPDQRQHIEHILRESQDRMGRIWGEFSPRARVETQRTRDQIKAILDPEQDRRFEELSKPRPRHRPEENPGPAKDAKKDRPRPPAGQKPASNAPADPSKPL